ncbi:sigma 54-interacting transcriptional regulator [Rhodanobacter sp. Col0626]|uniref:sigma 54-interacting transcriptional regulator n=1 Tax=Rhodanobacter sp. Col0626 TaxID=3415679 RepID=UPI003CEAC070
MLGQSQAIQAARAQLQRYAGCDVQVLIEGETGTGKELAAREIHYASTRREHPFVPVNCGAIPDSLIENELFGHGRGAFTDARSAQPGLIDHARGGTLFLDEVDSLSDKAQVTLLRFLQDNEYRPVGGGAARISDARIIAATNAGLEQQVACGRFRRDLHYRLNALYLRLPPLRERGEDVAELAAHFIQLVAARLHGPDKSWGGDAMQALLAYAWPGNVRELENVVLRAYMCTDGSVIGSAELLAAEPAFVDTASMPRHRVNEPDLGFSAAKLHAIRTFERDYLTHLMQQACGNISAAARLSGTERRQLGKLLLKHGIDTKPFRPH